MTIAAPGTLILVTSSAAVFRAADVGLQLWQAFDITGRNVGGRAQIASYISTTQVQVKALTNFDVSALSLPGNWFITAENVYGRINFAGESLAIQIDGSPGSNVVIGTDGSFLLPEPASIVQTGYQYLGLLATHNLDAAGVRGTAQGKIRKIRNIIARFLNSVACRIGTGLWDTVGLVFMEQEDLTDMPVPLYSDVLYLRPEDSWTRKTKQVIVMQDRPAPLSILSLDIEVETADE